MVVVVVVAAAIVSAAAEFNLPARVQCELSCRGARRLRLWNVEFVYLCFSFSFFFKSVVCGINCSCWDSRNRNRS